jgi:hypothetical protein
MEDRHQAVMAAAARLDTFLARATEEFGVSAHDRFERVETNRRITAWIKQARALPSQANIADYSKPRPATD